MYDVVARFNEAMNVRRNTKEVNKKLYIKLLEEEIEEWVEEAYADENSPEKELKELCDMIYIILGYAITQDWDIITAFNRVHDSNMSKLDDSGKPVYNSESGKVIKGKWYRPPNLKDLV